MVHTTQVILFLTSNFMNTWWTSPTFNYVTFIRTHDLKYSWFKSIENRSSLSIITPRITFTATKWSTTISSIKWTMNTSSFWLTNHFILQLTVIFKFTNSTRPAHHLHASRKFGEGLGHDQSRIKSQYFSGFFTSNFSYWIYSILHF